MGVAACDAETVCGAPSGHAEHVFGHRLRTSELYRQSRCLAKQFAPGVSVQAGGVDEVGDVVGDAVDCAVGNSVGDVVGDAVGNAVWWVGIQVGGCVQS